MPRFNRINDVDLERVFRLTKFMQGQLQGPVGKNIIIRMAPDNNKENTSAQLDWLVNHEYIRKQRTSPTDENEKSYTEYVADPNKEYQPQRSTKYHYAVTYEVDGFVIVGNSKKQILKDAISLCNYSINKFIEENFEDIVQDYEGDLADVGADADVNVYQISDDNFDNETKSKDWFKEAHVQIYNASHYPFEISNNYDSGVAYIDDLVKQVPFNELHDPTSKIKMIYSSEDRFTSRYIPQQLKEKYVAKLKVYEQEHQD